MAAQFGADLRTAALQFSASPDVAAALIVGAHTEAQILANVSSMQATIPPEFWAELKRQSLIDQPQFQGLAVEPAQRPQVVVVQPERQLAQQLDLTVGLSGHTGPGQLDQAALVREGAA